MVSEVIIDFLHLAATVVWIGGMVFIGAVMTPAISVLDGPNQGKVFGVFAKRFTIVAWSCTILLLITGLLKTPTELLLSFSGRYDILLAVKHLLFLGMIVGGLIITFVLAPRMRRLAPKPGVPPAKEFVALQGRIEMTSKMNLVLGVLVLLSLVMMRH